MNREIEEEGSAAEQEDITEANLLVSVGRGIGRPDNIPLIRKLADRLGGERYPASAQWWTTTGCPIIAKSEHQGKTSHQSFTLPSVFRDRGTTGQG